MSTSLIYAVMASSVLPYVNLVVMDDEDQPLGYLLHRAMSMLRPPAAAELGPLGLGIPEFVCMRILCKLPGQSNAELARHTNVSPQAMNLMLRGLQDMGAVTRPTSVASGRSLPARLTPKGRALLKRAEAAVQAADEQMMTQLSPAERRELKRLLSMVGSRATHGTAPSRIAGGG